MTPAFWRELQAILDQGYTGNILLHCSQGAVLKYELHETRRPHPETATLDPNPQAPLP